MSPRIRPAGPDDVPLLAGVEIEAGRRFRLVGLDAIADDAPPDEATLAAHVAAGAAWVTPDEEGVPVGYALASVVDGEGHLDQVSVVEREAGRGLGRILVASVERWSAAQGFRAVTLTTFVDVPWNGPWYRSLGYRFLDEGSLGPELAALRARERDTGLDMAPRAAMERRLA